MLPFQAPAGTTARDYLFRVVPDAHRDLVPTTTAGNFARDGKHWSVRVQLLGETAFRYLVDGAALTVTDDSRNADDQAHLVLALEKLDVERFLADWSGPRRYVPKFEPHGAALVTDPRVLSRVAQVTGSLAAVVPDFDGGAVRLSIAAFGGKLGRFDPRDDAPDVSVDLPSRLLEQLLGGTLAPDAALASGHVALRGKKLVAMQLAFALAPFFPPPPAAR